MHRQREIGPEEDEEEDYVVDSEKTTASPRQKNDSGDKVTERLRLVKGLTFEHFTKRAIHVTTKASVLILIEPGAKLQKRYQLRVDNSLIEVRKDIPFEVFIRNFSNTVMKLPKGVVVTFVAANPLAPVSLGGDIRRRIATCLKIVTDNQKNKPIAQDLVEPTLSDATGEKGNVDWKAR